MFKKSKNVSQILVAFTTMKQELNDLMKTLSVQEDEISIKQKELLDEKREVLLEMQKANNALEQLNKITGE